ncbi:cobalt-precorrin-6A reductase [Lentibacter algarum]|uniref:cobalt-precorrin-6A reductase n=1 Tax=Lentibacter algarum TaxID=576131 RepID=UPI001C079600|nr:cobalt-precorrin-6A reductase [Lentibacter algarum]MBU2981652.1 cobalt-precorrin-6A reductase [Lentibacter algarum]
MTTNLLILGGTTEAKALCKAVRDAGVRGVLSLAGRVKRPAEQGLPMRIGGFGGVAGLADHLRAEGVTHVVDATHPFAAQMSRNAVQACAEVGVSLLALTRQPWVAEAGDDWRHVPDIDGAVEALQGDAKRVMLAVGRMHLQAFAANPQHFYLLRLVDAPEGDLPFEDCEVVVARGPFDVDSDIALMREHRIELVVAKNAGGSGSRAKIDAARALGLPLIMINRPALPERAEAHDVAEVMRWLGH